MRMHYCRVSGEPLPRATANHVSGGSQLYVTLWSLHSSAEVYNLGLLLNVFSG